MKVLKTISFAVLALAMTLGVTSCDNPGGPSNEKSSGEPITVEVTGNISEDSMAADITATVSFNRFPANIKEYKQLREKLRDTPQGVVALQLMAMELYRFNQKDGEAALKLNCTTMRASETAKRLEGLLLTDDLDPQYARPYQVAGFLQGANPQNGYTADRPYTVEVKTNATPMQESSIYQANIITLDVKCGGDKLTGYRPGIQICHTQKPGEPNDGYIIVACSSMLMQVEPISYTATYPGLQH